MLPVNDQRNMAEIIGQLAEAVQNLAALRTGSVSRFNFADEIVKAVKPCLLISTECVMNGRWNHQLEVFALHFVCLGLTDAWLHGCKELSLDSIPLREHLSPAIFTGCFCPQ